MIRPPFSLRVRAPFFFVVGVILLLAEHSWRHIGQWDLAVYYNAGRDVWTGENPYTPEVEEGFENLSNLTVYVYPPLFARFISPLCLLPYPAFQFLWFLLQAVSFELLYFLGLRLFRWRITLASWLLFHGFGLHYDGVETDFLAGNTALMEAAVLTAWGAHRLDWPKLSEWMMGTLACVKPLTVFTLVWDLVRKRWRPFSAAAVTIAIWSAIMALDFRNFAAYLQFLGSDLLKDINEEHTAGIYNNSTVSVAFRLFTEKTFFKPAIKFPPLAYVMTFGVPIVIWMAVFAAWRRLDERAGKREEKVYFANQLGFCLLLPTVLLTIPRVADYTLIWLYVPFFFGAGESWSRRALVPFLLYVAAALVGNMNVKPVELHSFSWDYHWLHYRYVSIWLFWFAAWTATLRPLSPYDLKASSSAS